jgi:hypothetical protein
MEGRLGCGSGLGWWLIADLTSLQETYGDVRGVHIKRCVLRPAQAAADWRRQAAQKHVWRASVRAELSFDRTEPHLDVALA